MNQQELTDGLLSKRKEAIQYLVDTYQQNVIKTAFYFVSNMEDAEDLSQEVFLEILKSVGQFKNDASIFTWIYRITVNKSLDHLRKQKRRDFFIKVGLFSQTSSNGDNSFENETATTDTQHDDKEKRKILESAVGSLSDNQRIAFILNKYEELPYKEIAEIMNISLPSVESLIHRAKMNLQKKLVNHFSEYEKTKK